MAIGGEQLHTGHDVGDRPMRRGDDAGNGLCAGHGDRRKHGRDDAGLAGFAGHLKSSA